MFIFARVTEQHALESFGGFPVSYRSETLLAHSTVVNSVSEIQWQNFFTTSAKIQNQFLLLLLFGMESNKTLAVGNEIDN